MKAIFSDEMPDEDFEESTKVAPPVIVGLM
jgi:hypothetical protein